MFAPNLISFFADVSEVSTKNIDMAKAPLSRMHQNL